MQTADSALADATVYDLQHNYAMQIMPPIKLPEYTARLKAELERRVALVPTWALWGVGRQIVWGFEPRQMVILPVKSGVRCWYDDETKGEDFGIGSGRYWCEERDGQFWLWNATYTDAPYLVSAGDDRLRFYLRVEQRKQKVIAWWPNFNDEIEDMLVWFNFMQMLSYDENVSGWKGTPERELYTQFSSLFHQDDDNMRKAVRFFYHLVALEAPDILSVH